VSLSLDQREGSSLARVERSSGGPCLRSSSAHPSGAWIFSRTIDLAVFALPAALSLAIVLLRAPTAASADSPEWVWITGVLLVDVAHVWSTAFITYLNPAELRRHPERYWLVPGLGWVLGVVLYSLGGPGSFWRALAYLAVFHFVRQQYGWMTLYRARAGDRSRLGAWIDGAAIYAATLYPLIWWHAHLPRRFDWFLPGDFLSGSRTWLPSCTCSASRPMSCVHSCRSRAAPCRGANISCSREPPPPGTSASSCTTMTPRSR
jgi:hypothetical protein